MYLLADPGAGKPRDRFTRLLALHAAGERDLLARGLDDAHAWLPPRIAKRFGRRLEALGWIRDNQWTPYHVASALPVPSHSRAVRLVFRCTRLLRCWLFGVIA